MKIKLAHLEARLQALIEGSAARLFPNSPKENDLAFQLVESMRQAITPGPDGVPVAPNLFTVIAHPSTASELRKNLPLIESLTQTLREAGSESGLQFPSPPVIRIRERQDLNPAEVRVQARNSLENLPQTSDLTLEPDEDLAEPPPNAFLIVDGMQTYPLNQKVVNIGRRPDNHLVIDDARVSRLHAQLRLVRGRYVIFDLDSTGGTFVNSQSVHQAALYPGDVISLAGVPMVYGQDPSSLSDTQDIDSAGTSDGFISGNSPAPHGGQ